MDYSLQIKYTVNIATVSCKINFGIYEIKEPKYQSLLFLFVHNFSYLFSSYNYLH